MDTHSTKDSNLTKMQRRQKAYWCALNKVLDKVGGSIRGDKKPQPRSYMDYWSRSRLKAKFGLTAMMNTREKRVEVKLWGPKDAKGFWDCLEGQKEDIEKKLKFQLQGPTCTAQEAKIATRCKCVLHPRNKEAWRKQQKRIANRLNEMHDFFAPLVGIRNPQPGSLETFEDAQDKALDDPQGKYGPGGEGERHRNLKELIARNPDMLNLGSGDATVEHRFITGDRVDVSIDLDSGKNCVVEIEVEGQESTRIGAHQALKYRALRAAQLDTIRLPHAFLVAHSIPQPIKEFCERHGEVALEIPQD